MSSDAQPARGPEPLDELSLERHRDLAGTQWVWGPRLRIAIVAVLCLFVAAALLNQFGQRPEEVSVTGPAATLDVSTPHHLRGGLVFQTRIDVVARRPIAKPTIALAGGWFDGITLNSVQPGPSAQAGTGSGGATFAYPSLPAGRTLTVWLEWSVNPTTIAWRRDEPVVVADGTTALVRGSQTVTVMP